MKENKNIERLFQEKFKDFEASPPEDAWNNIASRLQEKKKKRRVIPFWFKASGIAASLILGLFVFQYVQNNAVVNSTNNSVVIEDNTVNKKNSENSELDKDNKEKTSFNEVVVETNKDVKSPEASTENAKTVNENIKKQDIIVSSSTNETKNTKEPVKNNTINKDLIKNSKPSEVVVISNANSENLVNPKRNEFTNKKVVKDEIVISNTIDQQVVVENNKTNQNSTSQKATNEIKGNTVEKETIVLNTIVNDKVAASNNLDVSKETVSKKNNEGIIVAENSKGENLVNPKINEFANKKVVKDEIVIPNTINQQVLVENNKTNQNSTSQKATNVIKGNTVEKETIVLNTIANDKVAASNNLDVSKEAVSIKNNEGIIVAENSTKTNNKNKTIVEDNAIAENRTNNKVSLVVVEKGNNFPNSVTKEQNAITETDKNKIIKPITKDVVKGLIKDSANVITAAETEVNALEQLLKEKDEGRNADEKEKEKRSKWAVSSNAAPVYFNSMAEGSPIDDQFTENAKSYATSLSYGIGLEYSLSSKLSIRSGINSIAVNYNTNDVYYANSLSKVSSTMNVSRNANGENLVLNNRNASLESSLSFDVDNFKNENVASLNQEMGYVEVPLELSYKIIDSKFGIEFIGGMSTLFLNKNEIALVSNGSEMVIGEANNLNSIHFSSNVGLGFKYSFWKSFNANFQPMFKYQINTFNEDSGNFKPYIIGLYSGISFNF